MKIRRIVYTLVAIILVGIFASAGSVLYLVSPRRDVEVALGVRFLPHSVRNIRADVDAWTDFVVRGYFEIDPKDFKEILAVRDYETYRYSPAVAVTDEDRVPSSRKGALKTISYLWSNSSSNCVLETDDTHEWVSFQYSTD